jgi:calcium/calmodulin-dependent protein kinase kinase 2
MTSLIHEEEFDTVYPEKVRITQEITQFVDHEVVNEYRLLNKIGEGKYGKVFKVEVQKASRDNEVLAMKVITKKKLMANRTSREESQLCINELKTLRTLHHPNIVAIKEVINDPKDKNLYLIMQHMSGKNL